MRVLVTGAAGFIGMHVCRKLLARGDDVLGVDSLNDYYDPQLKEARLAQLRPMTGFRFERLDLADATPVRDTFASFAPQRVVHLAAQAGVRYSLECPQAYVQSNLVGFGNVLEACRHASVSHLVYASSSSVYGANTKVPFSEADPVDQPVSVYAATKKSNELMAHAYSHLFGLPASGLRFFTVYGPWGRPDMAYWTFTRDLLAGSPLPVFNEGRMARDFTYIDDAVECVTRVLDLPPVHNGGLAAHRVLNVGNHTPVPLLEFIATLERVLDVRASMQFLPMQSGDIPSTFADTAALERLTGFVPATPLADGLAAFARWYRGHHGA